MSSFPVSLGVIYTSVCPSLPFSNLPFLFPPLSPFFPPYIPPSIQPSPSIQGTSYLFWSDRGELMSHFSLYFSLIMDGFHSLLIGLLAICVSFYVNCLFFFPSSHIFAGLFFFFQFRYSCLLKKIALVQCTTNISPHSLPLGIAHATFSPWLFRKYKNVLHKAVPMLTAAVRQGDKVHRCEMESENRSEFASFSTSQLLIPPRLLFYDCQCQ